MKRLQGNWLRPMFVLSLCATGVVVGANWRAPAAAIPAPAPAPATVGIINLTTLFAGLTEYKEGMALIDDKEKEGQTKLKEVEEQIKKVTGELEALKDPPMAKRLELQAKIAELTALGEGRLAALLQVLEVTAGDTMRRVFLKAVSSAEAMAKKDGLDVILIDDRSIVPPERLKGQDGKEGTGRRVKIGEVRSVIQQRNILVASDRVDVTPALLTLMNNEYKAGKK